MILDTIYFIVTMIVIIAACYGVAHLKAIYLVYALLYGLGGILSFSTAYLIFYPVFSATHYVFISGIVGFFVWSMLFCRLVLQYIFWFRKNRAGEFGEHNT